MSLGETIRKYREDNNLTLEELSTKTGLTKQYLSMLENNKNSRTKKPIIPSIRTLNKLAEGMNMSFDELLTDPDEQDQLGERALEFFADADDKPRTKDKRNDQYYLDKEAAEYAEMLRTRPGARMLFSAAKDMSKEEMEETVKYIEFLKSKHK
jgi:transcriptional regulator with XRE-family HTH domain